MPDAAGDLWLFGGYGYDFAGGFGMMNDLWRYESLAPTAVSLLSFGARPEGRAILLKWETASERDNVGFHLYRAESPAGDRVRLNGELIPSALPPGSPQITEARPARENDLPGSLSRA